MKDQGNKTRRLAMVVRQEEISPDIYSMWVRTDAAAYAKAGQFVSVFSRDKSRLLPRPLSICEINSLRTELRFVYRLSGEGTREFTELSTGDWIELMGPLGNGFPVDSESGPAYFIGGGVGIPPLLQLAKEFNGEKVALLGFKYVPYLKEEFEAAGCTVHVSTENGSVGVKGNIMGALLEDNVGANVIYSCGPKSMLIAVKKYAKMRNIKCYLSLEEHMACGIGACLGCACDTNETDEYYHVKKRCICKDGPVFLAEEVSL